MLRSCVFRHVRIAVLSRPSKQRQGCEGHQVEGQKRNPDWRETKLVFQLDASSDVHLTDHGQAAKKEAVQRQGGPHIQIVLLGVRIAFQLGPSLETAHELEATQNNCV